jgi:hypothetical protein
VRPDRFDKARRVFAVIVEDRSQGLAALELDLAIGPAWDLNDCIDNRSVVLVWIERDLECALAYMMVTR